MSVLSNLHHNVRILLITSFFLSLSFGLSYPYLSEYIYGISGYASSVGIVISMRSAISIPALILGGYLSDKVGRKKTMGAGTVLLGIAQLMYASARTLPELLVAAICDGLSAIYFPSINAMIMDTTEQRRLTGIFTLSFIVEHIPYMVTPAAGGYLRDTYGILGLRVSFIVTGLVTIIVGLARLKLLYETLSSPERINARALLDAYRRLPEDFINMRKVVRRLILLRGLCLIAARTMFYYFAVLYATRYTGVLSFTEWGLMRALASAASPISLPLLRLIGRFRLEAIYAHLILVEGLSLAIFMVPNKVAFIASMIPLNVCGALTYAIERSIVAREVEVGMRARAETLMILSFYLGDALGSYVGGLFYAWNPANIFPIASILLIIGSILGFIILSAKETS